MRLMLATSALLLGCTAPMITYDPLLPQTTEVQDTDADPEHWSVNGDLDWGMDELALALPLPNDVTVEVHQGLKAAGYMGLSWRDLQGNYTIWLAYELPESGFMLETLAHEWAHCACGDACTESDHGAVWAVQYGKAYRALFER